MIRASPDLESLSLIGPEFFLEPNEDPPFDIRDLFSELAGIRFPRLRSFRCDSEWISPTCPHVRRFLLDHLELHTLTFGSLHEDMPRHISPSEMAIAAAALRHFEGPAFLVEAILESELSGQIGSLTVGTGWDDQPDAAMLNLISKPRSDVRSLRVLCIKCQIHILDLPRLVMRTPMLEELQFFAYVMCVYGHSHYSERVLDVLTLAPRLHTLTIVKGSESEKNFAPPTAASVKRLVERAASICPWLRRIHHTQHGKWVGTWCITRLENDVVDMVYVYPKGWHLFPALDLPCVKRPSFAGSWSRLYSKADDF
ncbi:hypothetical protein FRC08_004209 [Ceratobasidium sp. 394]|nr:hypothetical protein FRC08_004209 [Ceratobasidium sp. 394]